VRCQRCGAIQANGSGYCRVCAAPLGRVAPTRPEPSPAEPGPASGRRSRWLTGVALASVAFLLLVCLALTALAFGLSSLIRWA
jgi:hypothetical protein